MNQIRKKNIVILISGRGSNMERIIEESQTGILSTCCRVSLVVSNRKDAKGLQVANGRGVATKVIESRGLSHEDFASQLLFCLGEVSPDYIILAGFMKILPSSVIHAYPKRIINIHPADTSKHQGLNGYRWAFESGQSNSVITVHYVDEGVDTGQVIDQQSFSIKGLSRVEEVEKRGLRVEHQFYSKVLQGVLSQH